MTEGTHGWMEFAWGSERYRAWHRSDPISQNALSWFRRGKRGPYGLLLPGGSAWCAVTPASVPLGVEYAAKKRLAPWLCPPPRLPGPVQWRWRCRTFRRVEPGPAWEWCPRRRRWVRYSP